MSAVHIEKNVQDGCLEETVFLNLLRTVSQLNSAPTALFKKHGLTAHQYNVLRILSGAPDEGLTCAQIRERMVARVPDVTRMVDRLIDAGLVIRDRCQVDRRVVRVTVSDAGRRLAKELAPTLVQLHRSMLGHLGHDGLESLNTLLTEITKNQNEKETE